MLVAELLQPLFMAVAYCTGWLLLKGATLGQWSLQSYGEGLGGPDHFQPRCFSATTAVWVGFLAWFAAFAALLIKLFA